MTAATTLQRLLKYPHSAVFDKAPGTELALRVRNHNGLTWVVADGKLLVTTGQSQVFDGTETFNGLYDWGSTTREYDLMGQTLGQLANALRADGHDVVFEDDVLSARAAHTLTEGSGDQDLSNGDHLTVYTSVLWALLSAYAGELSLAEYQIGQALRQMILTQAEGEWLDVWASIYGVPRRSGEADGALQDRIPQEVFRHRVNGFAIEEAIHDATGFDVTIDEPWKRMFLLNDSRLSDVDHLQDGRYYTYHVIQPVGRPGTRWADVYPHVERNKAAGIEIYAPRIDFDARHVQVSPPVEYSIDWGMTELRSFANFGFNNQVLGILRLDDEPPIINHPVARHDWSVSSLVSIIHYDGVHHYDGEGSYGDRADGVHVGLQTHQQIAPAQNIAMASIVLSEGPASGDENFIFSRGAQRVEFEPDAILSDEMFLSHYEAVVVTELVELVTTDAHGDLLEWDFTPTALDMANVEYRAFTSTPAYPLRTWVSPDNQYFDGSTSYAGSVSYSGFNTDTPLLAVWGPIPWRPDWRVAGMTRTDTPA
jgi:hypothetical protein